MLTVRWRRLSLLFALVGVFVTSVVPSLGSPVSAAVAMPARVGVPAALGSLSLPDGFADTAFVRVAVSRKHQARVQRRVRRASARRVDEVRQRDAVR